MTSEPSEPERDNAPVRPERSGVRAAHLWLLIPLIGTLIPPIYNTTDPTLIGIPFFYWYLLLWVPIGVLCTVLFYRATKGDR